MFVGVHVHSDLGGACWSPVGEFGCESSSPQCGTSDLCLGFAGCGLVRAVVARDRVFCTSYGTDFGKIACVPVHAVMEFASLEVGSFQTFNGRTSKKRGLDVKTTIHKGAWARAGDWLAKRQRRAPNAVTLVAAHSIIHVHA